MKILVIYTGGTIGSTTKNGVISTDSSTQNVLISRYNSCYDAVDFDEVAPFTMLSENLSADELNKMISAVKSNASVYDGIILTHGTDTLQYSAAALSLALGDIAIPVVLVSSNYPLEDERANGFDNFVGAVSFIKSKCSTGVFVSYKNEGEPVKIHLGTRLLPQRPFSDYLDSVDSKPYAVMNDSIDVLYDASSQATGIDCELVARPHILFIDCHPADAYSYSLADVNAVIINAYHSGTLNTSNQHFTSFCSSAKDRGIPVFAVNVSDGNIYDSATVFDSLGIIPLPKCSPITAYVKAWLSISANLDIIEYMKSNINNEY